MLSNGVVGCCPSGSQCGGTVNPAQITTITEYLTTTTQYPQAPSTNVQIGSKTTTVLPGIILTQCTTTPIVYNGYCSTLTANGPGLPTTAQGKCGTILVINRADVRSMGWKLPVLIIAFHGVLVVCSCFGFFRWRC